MNETIRFISDGDRFMAILSPRNEEKENTIKALFAGVETEELYKAVPYKDVTDISEEKLPENEPEQAQLFYCRYLFRKKAKDALSIFGEADRMYSQWHLQHAYRKAVLAEFNDYSQYFDKYLRKIILRMPTIFGQFVMSGAQQSGMAQKSFEESVNAMPPEGLNNCLEGVKAQLSKN